MIKKQLPTDQNIIDCIETVYCINVIKLTFIPLGADMNASIYKATSSDKSYFVKLKHGKYDNSAVIVELLHNAGIQVIPPQKTINGQLSHRLDDITIIVYPFEGLLGPVCKYSSFQFFRNLHRRSHM